MSCLWKAAQYFFGISLKYHTCSLISLRGIFASRFGLLLCKYRKCIDLALIETLSNE